jgi:putative colanic acid biosynthesis acetyltransferase WcaF
MAIRQGVDPHTEASFSFGHRLARLAWGLVWTLLGRWTPRPLHAWRALLLRSFGARLGRNCHVYPSAIVWAPWNLVMEDEACLGSEVRCYSMARITIGRRAVVSQGVHLCAGTHDFEDPSFQLMAFPIEIGAQSWICAEAFVGPGVRVGEGAVVGARAVAVRNIEPWTVNGGNPCRVLRKRKVRDQTVAAVSSP